MAEFNQRLKARQEEFMSSFDFKEQLDKREFHAVELRKTKRNELSQLRRAQISNSNRGEAVTIDALGLPAPSPLLQSLFPALSTPLPFCSKVQLLLEALRAHRCDDVSADTLHLLRMYFAVSRGEVEGYLCRELVQEALWFSGTPSQTHISAATWMLSNLLSTMKSAVEAVFALNGGAMLISLLDQATTEVTENVFFCLANIAGDSIRGAQLLISLHAPEAVITSLKANRHDKAVKRAGSWLLSNVVRYETDVHTVRVVLEMTKVLGREKSKKVRMNVLYTILFVSFMHDEQISVLFSLDLISPLIALLPRAPTDVSLLLLRTFINIAAGGPRVTQLLLDLEVLDAVHSKLGADGEGLRAKTVELLANVAAGTKPQVEKLVNHPILREAIARLSDASLLVRTHVARLLSNLSEMGSVDHMVTLTSFGVFSILKSGFEDRDPTLLLHLLAFVHHLLTQSRESGHKGLESRFETLGCIEALAKLQNHSNQTVAETSVRIQEEFFEGEEPQQQQSRQEVVMEAGFVFS